MRGRVATPTVITQRSWACRWGEVAGVLGLGLGLGLQIISFRVRAAAVCVFAPYASYPVR